jgi:hypothetical protein
VLLVGIDWAERHHDVCLMAANGQVLAAERIVDGVVGVARLHELIAGHASDPAEVMVGIETDRGLLVGALVAAGYQVVAVNPLAASRYRERRTISRAKSDRGDARMLADLVRTDRHHHRQVAGDSGLAEAVKVLARGTSSWSGLIDGRPTSYAAPCGPSIRQPWPPSEVIPVVGMRSLSCSWPRPLSWAGRCRMPSWWRHCVGRAGAGRSRPALPVSRPPWRASSWRRRR